MQRPQRLEISVQLRNLDGARALFGKGSYYCY